MRFISVRTFSAKLLLVLCLFSLPSLAPPSDTGPIDFGPETVQAGTIPLVPFDFNQIHGFLADAQTQIVRMAQFIRNLQMGAQNLAQLGEFFGWDGMSDFFAPANEFMNDNFDSITSFANSSIGTWGAIRDHFFEARSSGTVGEQIRETGKFVKRVQKDMFMTPARVGKRLDDLRDRVRIVEEECMGNATGNMSQKHCSSHLRTLKQRGYQGINRLMARKSLLKSSRKMHGQFALDLLQTADSTVDSENRKQTLQITQSDSTLFDEGPDTSPTPRLN